MLNFGTQFRYPFSVPNFGTQFQYPISVPNFGTQFRYPISVPNFGTQFQSFATSLPDRESHPIVEIIDRGNQQVWLSLAISFLVQHQLLYCWNTIYYKVQCCRILHSVFIGTERYNFRHLQLLQIEKDGQLNAFPQTLEKKRTLAVRTCSGGCSRNRPFVASRISAGNCGKPHL